MYLGQLGKKEKDSVNGRKIKDGIKDGDSLSKAKELLFKVYLMDRL
jgi:hypothetical protein